MAGYAFLSPEWTEEAHKIQQEYAGRIEAPPVPMRMNLVVTAVPFGEGSLDAHVDTSDGSVVLESGHLEAADLKVTVDYETAKAILVDQNPQAGMQAFMAGKIKVEGDMSKLLAMQAGPIDAVHAEVAARVRSITE